MLIKNDFEVAQPVDKVWQFFDDIPQVAACLPGAELTEDLGDDKYERHRSPSGWARSGCSSPARPRSPSATRRPSGSWSHAAGADEKGRGQASMVGHRHAVPGRARHQGRRRPGPAAVRRGRAVRPGHDLRRHRGADARLRREHAGPDRAARARRVAGRRSPPPAPGRAASRIGLRAARMALTRVFRRFFLPYQPSPS